MEPSEYQDTMQEDTLMEAGRIPTYHPVAEHHKESDTLMEHETASVDNSGMDVDSHMNEVPKDISAESAVVSNIQVQSSLLSIHSDIQAESITNTDAAISSPNPPTTSTSSSNPEDRIDAALAGKDEKDDGYESSDLESSDDDDEGPESSDSDSDSEMEMPLSAMTTEQREKALIEIDEMDEEDESASGKILHTANEIVQLPEVKKPDIVLGPDTVLEPIGTVMSIVDNVVVVQAASSGEVRVLDAGTVAAIMLSQDGEKEAQREVLGEIFETFGPVARPLYSIRFNTAAEIPTICTIGCKVYSVPEYSSFVLTGPLKAMKGSDASNKFDEEVHESEMEFSDDEKEVEHNRLLKQRRKMKGKKDRKVPDMDADTSAAMQAMMGNVSSTSSATRQAAPQGYRKPIALPRKPMFNDSEDGYRILQRPGDMSGSQDVPKTQAGAGTVPWYQQQQRELQNMIGSQQHQPLVQQQRKEQDALLQFQKQQQIRQELLLQQQQQQQLFQQQQQQQAAYQKQIQEAQATIMRLQQQQNQLQQQHQQQQQQQQQPDVSHQMNASFNPQQVNLQPTGLYLPQQTDSNSQQQQIANLLSPLFHPTQNQPPQ
ncbi:hypothetical protein BGZ46_005969 [Entomortierella lignicola]|nr:hypothetical protein BGZ46_005969 [Entomortierella lignicola]